MKRFVLMIAVTLAGYGCGNNDSFTQTEAVNDTGARNITLLVPNNTLGSADNDSVIITATVLDTNNVVLASAPITISASSGQVLLSAPTTDTNGQVTATLTAGADKSNRTIRITATSGTLASQSADIEVTGTQIVINGATSISLNGTLQLNVTASDSAGNGIPGAVLSVRSANGNSLSASTLTTNASGLASVDLTARVSGSDTITVSGLGTSATTSVSVPTDQFTLTLPDNPAVNSCAKVQATWATAGGPKAGEEISFYSTRGDFYTNSGCSTAGNTATTDAQGVAAIWIRSATTGPAELTAESPTRSPSATGSFSFIAGNPAKIVFSADRTTIPPESSATLTAIVRDGDDNLVEGAIVDFQIVADLTGGSLSPASGTTNGLGRAGTVFSSSAASSTTEGIIIRARVRNTTIAENVYLTVGQQALGLSIGVSDYLSVDSSNSAYIWSGSAVVTDAAGNAVPNQLVTFRVRPIAYDKGFVVEGASLWTRQSSITGVTVPDAEASRPCKNEDVNANGILDLTESDADGDGVLDPAEDLNGNGIFDEDYNQNGRIEPGPVVSITGSAVTDTRGIAVFELSYPKDFWGWTEVKITAATNVVGSDYSTSKVVPLNAMAADLALSKGPPGEISPFGTGNDCTDPD